MTDTLLPLSLARKTSTLCSKSLRTSINMKWLSHQFHLLKHNRFLGYIVAALFFLHTERTIVTDTSSGLTFLKRDEAWKCDSVSCQDYFLSPDPVWSTELSSCLCVRTHPEHLYVNDLIHVLLLIILVPDEDLCRLVRLGPLEALG